MTVNQDAVVTGEFYVTVTDGTRRGFLLGPYPDLRDALANESRGRRLAAPQDPFNQFLYGTARAPEGANIRTVFGR